MSFDYDLLGKKLREARESLRIEPQEVADHLHIGLERYLRFESGEEQPTGDHVVMSARLFRRDFRYFVTGDYPSAESQVQEMFRQNAALSRRDRIAIQEFARLCEYEAFLEDLLDLKHPVPVDYSEYHFGHSHYKTQGAEVAVLERERIGLDDRPISDVFKLIRDEGVTVFKRELEDRNISGLYLWHPVAGHCILVNYLDDLYRQNFSAAHEYCHVLFDSAKGQQVSYSAGPYGGEELEWRANSFAGDFLVPKSRLQTDYSPQDSYGDWVHLIPKIARRFGVSSQVIVIRFAELDWLDGDRKRRLLSDKRLVIGYDEKFDPEVPSDLSPGTKTRLTEAIRSGLSWHFLRICAEAYRRGEITYLKALEMLLLPVEKGTALLDDISVFLEVNQP